MAALGLLATVVHVHEGLRADLGARKLDVWCEAGANHHLALVPGRQAEAAEAVAEIAGLEFRLV